MRRLILLIQMIYLILLILLIQMIQMIQMSVDRFALSGLPERDHRHWSHCAWSACGLGRLAARRYDSPADCSLADASGYS
jgi:hypothetical protein